MRVLYAHEREVQISRARRHHSLENALETWLDQVLEEFNIARKF